MSSVFLSAWCKRKREHDTNNLNKRIRPCNCHVLHQNRTLQRPALFEISKPLSLRAFSLSPRLSVVNSTAFCCCCLGNQCFFSYCSLLRPYYYFCCKYCFSSSRFFHFFYLTRSIQSPLLQQTNKQTNTLNAREFRAANFASKIRAQFCSSGTTTTTTTRFSRKPKPSRGNESTTTTTTPLVEDVDCIFLFLFLSFLSHFFGGSGKEEGRQNTSIRRLS